MSQPISTPTCTTNASTGTGIPSSTLSVRSEVAQDSMSSNMQQIVMQSTFNPDSEFGTDKHTVDITSSQSPSTNLQPTTEFDVACYREKVKGMSDAQIQNLIDNVFKPDTSYKFPKSGGSFLFNWFNSSPSTDGAFCLSYVLFGDCFPNKAGRIKLFSELFTHWSDATATFKSHMGAGLHFETSQSRCLEKLSQSIILWMKI